MRNFAPVKLRDIPGLSESSLIFGEHPYVVAQREYQRTLKQHAAAQKRYYEELDELVHTPLLKAAGPGGDKSGVIIGGNGKDFLPLGVSLTRSDFPPA